MNTKVSAGFLNNEFSNEVKKGVLDLNGEVVPINNNSDEVVPIAAVDSSFVVLGQDSKNYYTLLRSALVFRKNRNKISVVRSGPFLFKSEASDNYFHEMEIGAILHANETIFGGIILVDGLDLKEIESKLKSFHKNTFISIDKVFQFENAKISSVFPTYPFVISLKDNTFLARLSYNGFIVKLGLLSNSTTEACKVLSLLVKNDELSFGYPLTLKLAHIFSKILPYEASSARVSLYIKEKVNVTRKLDGRKLLLGSLWC
ncbi:MAG: hypothetical protein QXS21_03810 [Thermoproteota archaeon]|nr:hypothetical protein [Candidatus Brockarchaeota archaeon]MBO3762837.1 hypothetical protein [Candidatus Brockarchaeota archaeon]MBO3768398.1 hypothetical protein [Candidatus Brockarchaeota archaeon]MBO3801517.1 hypothetical protein [Candidatus Brockarchaeota archaeon]